MGAFCSLFRKQNDSEAKPIQYSHKYDYDLIVIGGGSGGLSAAKEAAKASQKVLLVDYVLASPIGNSWGIGGTCTNVGCVPKKLMHAASLIGDLELSIAPSYGFKSLKQLLANKSESNSVGHIQHSWTEFVGNVQSYIQSLNWKYRLSFFDDKIEYWNAYAKFEDPHKILTMDHKNEIKAATANHFLIAIGGRPKYLEGCPGGSKEEALCITSDDIFSQMKHPGKVCIVGGSYVALECAGFLNSLNCSVTVLVRSTILRGFDQDMADRIRLHMTELGIVFFIGFEPKCIEKLSNGKLFVVAKHQEDTYATLEDEFDTVLLAIGRETNPGRMNLGGAGVKTAKSGRIIVNEKDQTSASHIYAIGDCAEGRIELSPVAIKAGKLLAERLYLGSSILADYEDIPTTIFTPLEYGCIGLGEEEAIQKFGKQDIIVYQKLFQPLEFAFAKIYPNTCYTKLVCRKSRNEEVVGFHYFGPNAGEVTQGFALGFKFKATRKDYNRIMGIHPTCAERFTTLYMKKDVGVNALELEKNC